MKKIVSVLLAAVMCLALVFSVPTTASAAATNNFRSTHRGTLYVGKKYFFATKTGIYTAKSLTAAPKKIASIKSDLTNYEPPELISDGKTVFFTVVRKSTKKNFDRKYAIYSVSANGKNLKKLKTIDNGNYFELSAYYKGYLYFCSGYEHYLSNLYRMQVKTHKVKKLKEGSSKCFYFNGSLYCNRAHSDVSASTLYKLDPKTLKYKKYMGDAPFGATYYPYFVTQKIDSRGFNIKRYNVYTSSNGKSFSKSKKLPDNANVTYASGKTKYAVYQIFGNAGITDYKFTLANGKKSKISGLKTTDRYRFFYNADVVNDNLYFIYMTDSSVSVQKLSGTKAVNCKIGGKSKLYIKNADNLTVANGYLVVDCSGKIKLYKLK